MVTELDSDYRLSELAIDNAVFAMNYDNNDFLTAFTADYGTGGRHAGGIHLER